MELAIFTDDLNFSQYLLSVLRASVVQIVFIYRQLIFELSLNTAVIHHGVTEITEKFKFSYSWRGTFAMLFSLSVPSVSPW